MDNSKKDPKTPAVQAKGQVPPPTRETSPERGDSSAEETPPQRANPPPVTRPASPAQKSPAPVPATKSDTSKQPEDSSKKHAKPVDPNAFFNKGESSKTSKPSKEKGVKGRKPKRDPEPSDDGSDADDSSSSSDDEVSAKPSLPATLQEFPVIFGSVSTVIKQKRLLLKNDGSNYEVWVPAVTDILYSMGIICWDPDFDLPSKGASNYFGFVVHNSRALTVIRDNLLY